MSDECHLALTHDADGNVSPLLCPGGGVNVLAWRYFAQGRPETLALGHAITSTQLVEAMCHDYMYVFKTAPLTMSAEELAAA